MKMVALDAFRSESIEMDFNGSAYPQADRIDYSRKIDDLDLEMVKMKFCLPVEKEGKGWTKEKADFGELWYKRFLKLVLFYPNTPIVPSIFIDEFWHGHILDTRKYHKDCQDIFGKYIHHFPYFGLRDAKDAQDLKDAYEKTQYLFKEHFGETPVGVACNCQDSPGACLLESWCYPGQ